MPIVHSAIVHRTGGESSSAKGSACTSGTEDGPRNMESRVGLLADSQVTSIVLDSFVRNVSRIMFATHALDYGQCRLQGRWNFGHHTYKPPMKKSEDTIIFCFLGRCKFQKYGNGATHNTRSVVTLTAVLT